MTVEEYLTLYTKFNAELDKICAVFPSAFEADLIEYAWVAFDWLLDSVANENGVNPEGLRWFIFENQQGENGYEVNDIPINNLDDFLLYETGTKFMLKNDKVVVFDIEEVNEDEIVFNYIPDDLTDEEVDELANMIEEGLTTFMKEVSE